MNISDEINALPKHLRDYIHELVTCVPADLVQENMALKENLRAMEAKYRNAAEAIERITNGR